MGQNNNGFDYCNVMVWAKLITHVLTDGPCELSRGFFDILSKETNAVFILNPHC